MASNPVLSTRTSHFNQDEWVNQVSSFLDEELEADIGIRVSVFNVPKDLLCTNPEAYVPHVFALGPYYHWSPELYPMERYKLAAAKRTQKHLQSSKLHHIADHFMKLELNIRAHYHRYLDFKREALGWMMAIDASFLLEFLHQYADEEGKAILSEASRMSDSAESTAMNSANNMVIRDIMMLENQIPLFLLRKILFFICSSSQVADELLSKMLIGLVKEVSPFKMMDSFQCVDGIILHAHLLELLYYMIVPKSKEQIEVLEIVCDYDEPGSDEQIEFGNSGYVKQLFQALWNFILRLNAGPISLVKRVLDSNPLKVLVKIPFKTLTNLPGLSFLKPPADPKSDDPTAPNNGDKPPSVEEIMIPSITDLVNAGVKLRPVEGGLEKIMFDAKTGTLQLPTINLDVNSEVILRNLVAYEATTVHGPLVFTRYTEMMNGIIDTEDDAKLLRERGVILNHMKKDKEVAELWNGMSKSVRLTRVPLLDKAIEDVNKYYNRRWSVKTNKLLRKYVFGSWQFLTLLATIVLLSLTTLQAFCSVYTCARWFGGVSLLIETP